MGPRRLHVVIATDFSPAADVALGESLAALIPSNAVIDLVHVIEPASDPQLQGSTFATSPAMSAWANGELDKRAARLRALGFVCDVQLRHGLPSHELARHASDHDAGLIVLGVHRRPGGIGRLATALLAHPPCSVLIMAPPR